MGDAVWLQTRCNGSAKRSPHSVLCSGGYSQLDMSLHNNQEKSNGPRCSRFLSFGVVSGLFFLILLRSCEDSFVFIDIMLCLTTYVCTLTSNKGLNFASL